MMTQLAHDTYFLMLRSLRELRRQPVNEIGNFFIPLFFFAVTVGAIGAVSAQAFGIDDYTGFQLPVAVLQGVAGAAGYSGIAMVTDIERGFFDKLLLTPAPRLALVLGRLAADVVRFMVLTIVIVAAGLIAGADIESGPLGVVLIVVMAGAFGLAYSGIGLAIALRTGSAQAAQSSFLLFFPLLFLSPAFAPKEFFQPWLEFLATINPITYVVEGMRDLVIEGWNLASLAGAFASIAGLATLTLSLTLMALNSRTR